MGNRYAEIEQAYHDAPMEVAVIVSRDRVTEFLVGRNHRLVQYSGFLGRLLANLRDRNGNEVFREMIAQTCQRHIEERYNSSRDKDYSMGPTTVASLKIDKPELGRAALDAVGDSFATPTFKLFGRLGFEKTREL
ncbi:uncharacterized protein Z519_05914 [Cladophialophora bantiana CBS 173.52]|uniref:Uncharacterized protein n=1 Tax=Cladophialophora bantiana (strain ATCC 10958 / CBS 173.52 / CDC B-1940 / NIH 8579) TaxID=1442370 RepID=A0A0D2I956_CLAB1|nr:uncharacterized protein Z519_05914 [Cladophialophora bantiana CBS 173.52]KIW93309.1 hypothetical protein Z519_05914 [Cladophialophora bantiana CBS 173.52]